jgi:hypothetical protein
VRKVKQAVDFDSPKVVTGETNTEINARSRRRYRGGGEMTLGAGKESVKTARLQDLFKFVASIFSRDLVNLKFTYRLVDLQSCIIDNSQSLSDVIHEIDHVLEEDVVCVLVCSTQVSFGCLPLPFCYCCGLKLMD